MAVVDHAGIADQFFTRRTDTGHPGLGISEFLEDTIRSLIGLKTPKVLSRFEGHFLIPDGKIDRLIGSPLENQEIVTCGLEFSPKEPPGI